MVSFIFWIKFTRVKTPKTNKNYRKSIKFNHSEIIAGLSGLTRTPFNVAHRGLPNEYNENSVSGTLAAMLPA